MANIDFYKQITPSNDTTLYGHNSVDEAGFPKSPGNFKLSAIMSQFISAEDNEIKSHFEFVEGLDRNYTLNYKGVAVATLRLPPDRFLKEAKFNPETKVLTLTFATEGEDSVVDIDFSSLIDVYSAGNGLTLTDATFSLKLQAGEARLRVSGAGLALDLSDITTSITEEAQTRANDDRALSVRIKSLEDSWNTFSTDYNNTKSDLQNTKNALAETNTKLTEALATIDDLRKSIPTKEQIKTISARYQSTQIIDLTSGYDNDKWYPIVGDSFSNTNNPMYIKILSYLKDNWCHPTWGSHGTGSFSLLFEMRFYGSGWGTFDEGTYLLNEMLHYDWSWTRDTKLPVVPVQQIYQINRPVIYFRGGGKYELFTSDESYTFTIYPNGYKYENYDNTIREVLSNAPSQRWTPIGSAKKNSYDVTVVK